MTPPGFRNLAALFHFTRLVLDAFVSSLRQNLGMGLLAIALSTSIWVFITNEQNPPRTGFFPFQIPVHPVNVPPDLDVLRSLGSVVVRITAPTDLWPNLTEDSFEATADLAGLTEGTSNVPVVVRARDARVRVQEAAPAQVVVELDQLRRQVVPVEVNVVQVTPIAFEFDPPRTETHQVTVLGPEALVSSVAAAWVDVNLSGARSNVRQSIPLIPRTARGYEVTGVRLEPASVVVEVPIRPRFDHATLPVVADIQGSPPPGFTITQVRVTPQTRNVTGPQQVLQDLGTLRTVPIEVSNLTSTTARTVSLTLPNGVTLLDLNAVQVEITIQPVPGSAAAQVPLQFRGLAPELAASSPVASIEILVSGTGPALRDFSPARASVIVNLEGMGPGTHTVEPQVDVPAGLTITGVTPPRLEVTVREREQGNGAAP